MNNIGTIKKDKEKGNAIGQRSQRKEKKTMSEIG
jgi:hypothetical protein